MALGWRMLSRRLGESTRVGAVHSRRRPMRDFESTAWVVDTRALGRGRRWRAAELAACGVDPGDAALGRHADLAGADVARVSTSWGVDLVLIR